MCLYTQQKSVGAIGGIVGDQRAKTPTAWDCHYVKRIRFSGVFARLSGLARPDWQQVDIIVCGEEQLGLPRLRVLVPQRGRPQLFTPRQNRGRQVPRWTTPCVKIVSGERPEISHGKLHLCSFKCQASLCNGSCCWWWIGSSSHATREQRQQNFIQSFESTCDC